MDTNKNAQIRGAHSHTSRTAAHTSHATAGASHGTRARHAHTSRSSHAAHGTSTSHAATRTSRSTHAATRTKKNYGVALPFLLMLAMVCLILMVGAFSYGMASAHNNPEAAEFVGLRQTTSAYSSVGALDEAVHNKQAAAVQKNAAANAAANENTSNNLGAQNGAGDSTAQQTAGELSTTSSGFNITAAATQIDEKHEQARLAAEAEQKKKDEEARARAEEMQKKWNAGSALQGLEEVDWSVGETAFIEEWTGRIDNYLKGTALAGYGATFARAAWENGIDPRWSPAISNTESGNGANCFLPHNAWGWGSSAWSSWEEAINGHVAGLARGYGYSITYEYAKKYCPPNTDFWFNNTLNQMKKI